MIANKARLQIANEAHGR